MNPRHPRRPPGVAAALHQPLASLSPGSGGRRPRRSASVVTAASSASISTSSNRFSAPARSSGKKWRCCEARLSGPALPFGTAEGPAAVTVGRAENRSGVVSAGRRVGMPQLCRRWLTAATACRAIAGSVGPAAQRSERAHIVGSSHLRTRSYERYVGMVTKATWPIKCSRNANALIG